MSTRPVSVKEQTTRRWTVVKQWLYIIIRRAIRVRYGRRPHMKLTIFSRCRPRSISRNEGSRFEITNILTRQRINRLTRKMGLKPRPLGRL